MDIAKYKILESDFTGKGVSAQPNPMEKPEDEAKAVFDELVKEVVTPKFNAFVEAFEEIDLTADRDKPVSTAVQEALDGKVDEELTEDGSRLKVLSDNNFTDENKKALEDLAKDRHSHSNKTTLDSITDKDLSDWRGGNVLTKDNTRTYFPTSSWHPATKQYVDNTVKKIGAADMTAAVYDPQGKETDIFAYVDSVRCFDDPLAWVGGVYRCVKTTGTNGLAVYTESWTMEDELKAKKVSSQKADGWTEMFTFYKDGFETRKVLVTSQQDADGNWTKTVEEQIILM